MSVPAQMLNSLFFEKVATSEGKEKIAEFGGTYIRDRLREVSFARKIVPPTPVQRTELQRSVNHDTLVKIVDIEPNSRAMSLTFRGQPTARLIRAPRFEIPFFTISSEKFEKHEQELLAYEMPITKIIEENSVKDIQAIEDRQFLLYVEAAVQAMEVSDDPDNIAESQVDPERYFSFDTTTGGEILFSAGVDDEKKEMFMATALKESEEWLSK